MVSADLTHRRRRVASASARLLARNRKAKSLWHGPVANPSLESERPRAKLFFLPKALLARVVTVVETPLLQFVEARIAITLDIQLAVPLRPQNLIGLHWSRHFVEPDGPTGWLLLHIRAEETKAKRQDFNVGFLRMSLRGSAGIGVTAKHIGVHMTPHQFRHFAANIYLDANPEDHQTVQVMLHQAPAPDRGRTQSTGNAWAWRPSLGRHDDPRARPARHWHPAQ